MRKILLLAILIAGIGINAQAQNDGAYRQTILFSQPWKFSKGNFKGAQNPAFDDTGWQTVRVPHDWAIAGPFDPLGSAETGKLPWKGEGWYRHTFTPDPAWKGKQLTLLFDGVMAFPVVWLNGKEIGRWDYGYNSFYLDVSDHIVFGQPNVLAVYVDTRRHESRWYPGAGIYRKVTLTVTDPVHVAQWGTQVTTPEISADRAMVQVRTRIVNDGKSQQTATVHHIVLDPSGRPAAVSDTLSCPVKAGEDHPFTHNIRLLNPQLWDVEQPNLYTLQTIVRHQNGVCDVYTTRFGVRSAGFSADNGFWLNGRRVALKGVCLHHDFGALGGAFNYRAMQRQLEILRDMGCNAIRTSHNAPAPELLDLCDEMGFVVVDELFDKWDARADILPETDFQEFARRQVRNFVQRDRNHPCIILWSCGNEIGDIQGNVNGGFAKLELMTSLFRLNDPTRPVTLVCDNRESATLRHMDYYDVICYNYGRRYDKARQLASDHSVIISESASTVSTRGYYNPVLPAKKTDFEQQPRISSYDLNAPEWAEIPEDDFNWQWEDRFVAGEFVWTGFDYLGEPTPYGDFAVQAGQIKQEATARSSYFGIVDLAGIPKDRYYLYKSLWRPGANTVHLLPHWNWKGAENQPIPVFVYTDGDEAELFLNGRSLGRRTKQPLGTGPVLEQYRLMWDSVPYQPGTLRAVAYRDGQLIGEDLVRTAGKPASVRLTPDRSLLRADGDDLSFVLVEVLDAEGNLCPLADHLVRFELSGPADIAGVDNGDPVSLAPFQASEGRVFYGKSMLIVRTREGQRGAVTVKATSSGLRSGQAVLKTE
ncbi:MAG: DUF4982 domain-containing protein [Saprospiraceae bacterium]|nr:DUF4982 domain-containing protein [Saprospiraceae bacterium]